MALLGHFVANFGGEVGEFGGESSPPPPPVDRTLATIEHCIVIVHVMIAGTVFVNLQCVNTGHK